MQNVNEENSSDEKQQKVHEENSSDEKQQKVHEEISSDEKQQKVLQNARIFLLKGKISFKQNKYNESIKYFEEGMKLGDKESMYRYGIMHFLKEGNKNKEKDSIKYIIKSNELGYLNAVH